MYFIARWLITTMAIMLTAYILPGIEVTSFYIGLIVSLIIGLLNAIVRPIIILLTLPITIVTLGIFILVINGLLFWFTASFIEGFRVDGFLFATIGALFVSVISWMGNKLILDVKDTNKKDYYVR
jgi:putative membrane protein